MDELLEDLKAIAEGIKPVRAKAGFLSGKILGLKKKYAYPALACLIVLAAVAVLFLFPKRGQAFDSIAVLPFVNQSGDAEQDIFCDSVHRELIMQLSRIKSIRTVIAKQTMMAFKRVLELYPSYAMAHAAYANNIAHVDRQEEVLFHCARARELDPLDFTSATVVFNALLVSRQYEKSTELARELIALDINKPIPHNLRAGGFFMRAGSKKLGSSIKRRSNWGIRSIRWSELGYWPSRERHLRPAISSTSFWEKRKSSRRNIWQGLP